jgi:hypothetical protein
MNEREIELARAFAGCPKWTPVERMVGRDPDEPAEWAYWDGAHWCDSYGDVHCRQERFIPDIDDALTVAGLIVVVRKAWGHALGTGVPHLVPRAWTRYDNMKQADWDVVSCGSSLGGGDSEVAAMLAALRAAP